MAKSCKCWLLSNRLLSLFNATFFVVSLFLFDHLSLCLSAFQLSAGNCTLIWNMSKKERKTNKKTLTSTFFPDDLSHDIVDIVVLNWIVAKRLSGSELFLPMGSIQNKIRKKRLRKMTSQSLWQPGQGAWAGALMRKLLWSYVRGSNAKLHRNSWKSHKTNSSTDWPTERPTHL